MALAYKIDKATFDKLSKDIQEEYVTDGEGYKLDVTGAEFASAEKFTKERDKRRAAETKQREAEDKLREFQDGDDRPQMQQRHDRAIAAEKAKTEAAEKKFNDYVDGDIKSKAVDTLTTKLTKSPALLRPHVAARVGIDRTDPSAPKAVVLGADGKPSGKTFDELGAEFLANKDFSAIVTVSQATGGAASKPGVTGGSGFPSRPGIPTQQQGATPPRLSDMSPPQLAAHMREVRAARAGQQGQ